MARGRAGLDVIRARRGRHDRPQVLAGGHHLVVDAMPQPHPEDVRVFDLAKQAGAIEVLQAHCHDLAEAFGDSS